MARCLTRDAVEKGLFEPQDAVFTVTGLLEEATADLGVVPLGPEVVAQGLPSDRVTPLVMELPE
jgi:hypothetical protein